MSRPDSQPRPAPDARQGRKTGGSSPVISGVQQAAQRLPQLLRTVSDVIGILQIRRRKRPRRHGHAAHPVGPRAGDVSRRVADHHRPLARMGDPSRPARRRAMPGRSARSSESEPKPPCPDGKWCPTPARASLSRATGSKLPVTSDSWTSSRPQASRADPGCPAPACRSATPGSAARTRARTPRARRRARRRSPGRRPRRRAAAAARSPRRSVRPARRRRPARPRRPRGPRAALRAATARGPRRRGGPAFRRCRTGAAGPCGQRSNDMPGSRRWAKAAISLAAASMSASETSSTGECM